VEGSTNDLALAIGDLVGVLTRSGIDYFVTGSVASSVRGEYRATNDIDIVAVLDESVVVALVKDASTRFVADEQQARDALAADVSFNMIHRATFLKVDIFPCRTDFNREALRRAQDVPLPGVELPLRVATTEDVLLSKLLWFRLGDEQSSVQRRDIVALVALNQAELDRAYLHRWARVIGVSDLVARFVGS
jgi:hypothetical protein